jgi:hypothetical protein
LSVNFCSEDEKEFKFYQIKTSEYLNLRHDVMQQNSAILEFNCHIANQIHLRINPIQINFLCLIYKMDRTLVLDDCGFNLVKLVVDPYLLTLRSMKK